MDKLIKAIRKGDSSKVGELLQDPNCNANGLDPKSGKNMLQLAMENHDQGIFKMLFNHEGIDLNATSKDGEMLLQTAILLNSVDFVDQLLRKKPNLKRKNGKGETVLAIAVKNSINPQILRKLILNNYDVNQPVPQHGSLCNLAIVSNQFDNFKILLEHPGINLKIVDEEENTSLLLTTKLKKADFIFVILQRLKAKIFTEMETQFYINHQDEDGNSALHIAAIKDYQTIMDLLLREGKPLGLDLELKNKQGKSYEFFIQQRKNQAKASVELEKRRQEQKILKRKEKQDERQRQIKEEQMVKAAKKRQQKEQQIRLAMEIEQRAKTMQSKRMWACGIFVIALLGAMYLLILNAIPAQQQQ